VKQEPSGNFVGILAINGEEDVNSGLDCPGASAFLGLARSRKLHYAGSVASGVFPPTRYLLFRLRIKFL
jgi:hypothetical protein